MGNIPTPYENIIINSMSMSTTERKLLISKMTSLSACIVGTAVYLRPAEPHFAAPYFGILLPAFLTGYILISSSEIFMIFLGRTHIFLESSFAIIGALGSGVCGVYEFYRWIDWIIITYNDVDKDYGSQEFMLAMSCLLNSAALITVAVYRELERQKSLTANE